MERRDSLAVGQSGGPTAVINRSLVGVIREARDNAEIDKVLVVPYGTRGLLDGRELLDVTGLPEKTLSAIAALPGSVAGSCRHRPTREECKVILGKLPDNGVGVFAYIGGNDTAETAELLSAVAGEQGDPLRVFHVPKTVDNDLCVTDHSPGFGSAARYVALSCLGSDLDNASLPGIKIDVCMGRNAGWLTAASALARQKQADAGPHLIYLPERPKSLQDLLGDIASAYGRHGRALVAVSEGLCGPDGELLVQSPAIRSELKSLGMTAILEWLRSAAAVEEAAGGATKDSFGHTQLGGTGVLADFIAAVVKTQLNRDGESDLRVRADTLGYAQRSFAGVVSETDAAEAELVGRAAVRYAIGGRDSGSVVLRRIDSSPDYEVETFLTALGNVAGKVKEMSDDLIAPSGNDVTEAYLRYVAPLVGDLPPRASLAF